jgi:hypothetical protein
MTDNTHNANIDFITPPNQTAKITMRLLLIDRIPDHSIHRYSPFQGKMMRRSHKFDMRNA